MDNQVHETAVIDDHVEIGAGTKIWHFCHVLPNALVGDNCVLGQNVMVGPRVSMGNSCKVQNNVSMRRCNDQRRSFCGPSCVFTTNDARPCRAERRISRNVRSARCDNRRQCNDRLRHYNWQIRDGGRRFGRHARCLRPSIGCWDASKAIGWVRTGDRLSDDLICTRTGERYELVASGLLRID